jgi:hypothetical protein
MNIDEMKVGELKQLANMVCGGKKAAQEIGGDVRIVILQRGWVAVGRYFRKGQQCRLKNGYIIRRWGTAEGLPELAMKGPLSNTVLDKSPDIEFHQLTEIANIACVEDKWSAKCPR